MFSVETAKMIMQFEPAILMAIVTIAHIVLQMSEMSDIKPRK